MNRQTSMIDAFSPESYCDEQEIAARFAALRAEGDVVWIDQPPYRPFWAVLRHADIMEVERNTRVWLNAPRLTLLPDWFEDRTIAQFGNRTGPVRTLLDMDEPDHRQHRQLTQSWFNSRNLDSLRERMRLLARDTVDRMAVLAQQGPFDFIEEVAVPYPLIMITTILGLPDSDSPLVLRLTQELFGATDPDRNAAGDFGLATAMEFFAYLGGVVQQRRVAPQEDLMSVIATATIDGAPLSDMETLSYGMLLAAAGHDTTSSSVGVGMMQLARHPDQFARLRQDPALVVPAAQEMFRWATPVRHFLRTAAVDTELAGQPIAAGEQVALLYLSGNRDERAFDAPDAFRIDRSPNRHLAFGYGAHHCLGRILAEMEVEALFAEIAARVEPVTLAGEPEWVKTNHTGGLKRLPVEIRMAQ
jgi:cytochrome P450